MKNLGAKFSLFVGVLLLAAGVAPLEAAKRGEPRMDELSLPRWAKLRETERYQLTLAEKVFRDKNYAGAAAEYEKFVLLYESSEGAAFAQFKWAMCQASLKKLNTAIKDGYRTVIDYWPDSPEAIAAAYLIGKTYKDMGDIPLAKKAYQEVIAKHGEENVALLAKVDLAEIARIEMDNDKRLAYLRDVVFKTERDNDTRRYCIEGARTLAQLSFSLGVFGEGKEAFATTYQEPDLSYWIWHDIRGQLTNLAVSPDGKEKAHKLADSAVGYFQQQASAQPADEAGKGKARTLEYYAVDMLIHAGRHEEVGKHYEQLLTKYGIEDDTLVRYGAWLKTQNRRADARGMYGRMKDQVKSLGQLAYMLREEQKYLEAAAIYQELVAKDAQNASGWHWEMGEAYRVGGKYAEAIAAFQQCENFPSNLDRIALCYRHLKQFPQAIATYTQILGGYEGAAPNALLQIGYTQEQASQSEAAIKTFQQVCKRFPKTGEASQAHSHLNEKYKILITLGGAKDE